MRFKWDGTRVRIGEQTGFSCMFFLSGVVIRCRWNCFSHAWWGTLCSPGFSQTFWWAKKKKKHHAEGVIESYCNAVTRVCLSDVWNGPDMFPTAQRNSQKAPVFWCDGYFCPVWGRFRGHSGIQEENIQRCLSLSVSTKINSYSCVFRLKCCREESVWKLSWLMISLFLLFQVTTSCQTTTNYELVSVIMCMCEFVQYVLDFVYKWDRHRRF